MLTRTLNKLVVSTPKTSITKSASVTGRRFFAQENVGGRKAIDSFYKALQKEGVSLDELNGDKFQQLVNKSAAVRDAYNNLKAWDEATAEERNKYLIEAKPPVRVAVTGASGQIGYSLLFRIASGEMLGKDQPVILQLLELPQALKSLEGVSMELNDCAFPLLRGIVQTSEAKKAFEGADFALLVGAKPRTKGMERADLLKENAKIFEEQGKALNSSANKGVKVLVVGNPANTNAMITSHFAPNIPASNIHGMMKLDHNRGIAQLAEKAKVKVSEIDRFVVWGNHSPTMYPDISHCQIKGQWAKDVLKDEKWYKETFIPTVQQRGAAIINARGSSSAASAANAAIDHMREWHKGTAGKWTSFAVPSDGSYGVEKGLWYGFPVVCTGGNFNIVGNIPIDKFSAERMEATRKELADEKAALSSLLK